ncbi:hypothetical protein Vadar_003843 [Vaccinium darrowii]|uniref:Uncharacterized protein n=1 Tax=Vaccinium darrowii TaxID=229202 RepID=A0ACB7XN49_9ERIC|nr:hypothetical protein Vadar_003843 [Vaccinium darrowii]
MGFTPQGRRALAEQDIALAEQDSISGLIRNHLQMADEMLTLHINVRGKFVFNPKRYVRGEVGYTRMPRTFPYFELVGVLNQYECPPGYTFEYLKPGHTLEDGLVQVQSEGHEDEDEDEQEDEDIGNDEPCGSNSYRGSDSDTNSDYACSGLRDSSSDDEDWGDGVHGIPRETGGTSTKAWEDLGKGVVVGDNEGGGGGGGDTDLDVESLSTVDSSDDEGNKRRGKAKVKYPEFLEERDMKNPKLVPPMLFPNVRVFRKLLKEYHLKHGCDFKYIKNESKRVIVKCSEPEDEYSWGQMMHTVERDANNQMYPIAMAVVEAELKDSWGWFLDILTDVIGKPADKGWIFISDRQKGLTESMDLLFPGVEHSKDEGVEGMSKEAHDWLLRDPIKHWARCKYSPRAQTGRMVNNISESFNNAIKEVRDKPILTMLEGLRRYVMQRLVLVENGMSQFEEGESSQPRRATSAKGRGNASQVSASAKGKSSQPRGVARRSMRNSSRLRDNATSGIANSSQLRDNARRSMPRRVHSSLTDNATSAIANSSQPRGVAATRGRAFTRGGRALTRGGKTVASGERVVTTTRTNHVARGESSLGVGRGAFRSGRPIQYKTDELGTIDSYSNYCHLVGCYYLLELM